MGTNTKRAVKYQDRKFFPVCGFCNTKLENHYCPICQVRFDKKGEVEEVLK